jgi:rod shape-determining protein MreC
MSTSRDDFTIAIRSALLQKGARQKYSLFFLICLSGIIFFLDSFQSKAMDVTKALLNDGVYRVSTIATSPIKFGSFLNKTTENHFFIYEENKKLKLELQKLRAKDFETEFLKTQNFNYQKILSSTSKITERSVIAKVIIDKESPFLKSIIVNKGSRSEVKKGMPVVANGYLVGKIVETNYLSSRVLLLNDLNSRIPVSLENSSAQAIITGYGFDNPKLEYLPENFPFVEGITIFTSGKDGVLAGGIPIGESIIENDSLNVKLFNDPNQLSVISIILTNFKEENKF